MSTDLAYDVVIPSAGRASLERTLRALLLGDGPWPDTVVVVDDRPVGARRTPLVAAPAALELCGMLRVAAGPRRGPAAARNVGWRAGRAPWVCFLDDDTVPGLGWRAALRADLERCGPRVGACQGRLHVPLPTGRRPTDWERDVAGLERARWATADMAYRRSALTALGGFDERFPRAYREDADLALRCRARGWGLARGARVTAHPVGPAGGWVSVRRQAGNADDQLMAALHGPDWRHAAGAGGGALRRHAAVTAAAAVALGGAVLRRPALALPAALAWLAGTGAFAWRRIAPGPRTREEVGRMILTSVAIPPVAVFHAARGRLGRARLVGAGGPRGVPAAVFFDRDATLIEDVPYNGDPARVVAMPGAARAVARVRAAGIPVGILTNQSGIARGLIDRRQADAVNARVAELLGPFDVVALCPHAPAEGCACRKPAPGMVLAAAAELGVAPADCVVIGDIGADVGAATAAGARGILVPTAVTASGEVAAAAEVAGDLEAAVARALGDALAAGPAPRVAVAEVA